MIQLGSSIKMRARCLGVGLVAILATLLMSCGMVGQAFAHVPRFCRVNTAQAALEAQVEQEHHSMSRNPRGIVLLVSQSEDIPGAWVYSRLADFGNVSAGYGREFAIERLTPSGWEIDPASPKGPWIKVLGRLNPGAVGGCYRFHVPATQPAGKYRFSTKIRLPLNGRRWVRRTAQFAVKGND
jgi:hypothetical protein